MEVFREDERVLFVRNGALLFWSVIAGISLFPLLCWAGGLMGALLATSIGQVSLQPQCSQLPPVDQYGEPPPALRIAVSDRSQDG